jgi:hypothetical protein
LDDAQGGCTSSSHDLNSHQGLHECCPRLMQVWLTRKVRLIRGRIGGPVDGSKVDRARAGRGDVAGDVCGRSFDPPHDRKPELAAGGPAASARTFLSSSAKKFSIAALSPGRSVFSYRACKPCALSAATTLIDRN